MCCWLQVDDTEVINFLLSTEIIPLCLRTMEMGSELSKTVATFIVQKILQDSVRPAPTSIALTAPRNTWVSYFSCLELLWDTSHEGPAGLLFVCVC